MKISGVAWCLGDNVSTDEILPGRYIGLEEGPELGSHALEGISPAISSGMSKGDVLIGGHNFGTGSSRESAPKALRSAGFSAIVAESFARIFYRNCINIGLVALWCEGVTEAVNDGDNVVIDLLDSRLLVDASKVSLPLLPLSPFAHQIVDSGGLVPYAKSRLGRSLVSDSEDWGSA